MTVYIIQFEREKLQKSNSKAAASFPALQKFYSRPSENTMQPGYCFEAGFMLIY